MSFGIEVQGGVPGRSAVSNARIHLGYLNTYSIKIKDWRRGQRTIDANLAAVPMDQALLHSISALNVRYTRFYSILYFSFSDSIENWLHQNIPEIIEKFKYNIVSARVQYGRRNIGGLIVDKARVYRMKPGQTLRMPHLGIGDQIKIIEQANQLSRIKLEITGLPKYREIIVESLNTLPASRDTRKAVLRQRFKTIATNHGANALQLFEKKD